MKKIFLIEDHDEALALWHRLGFKNLDLVHVDAHMDYSVHPARPLRAVLEDATSVRELKEKLEYTLAFQKYQKDLSRQTDIGNYIYSAMEDGIVRNFTWVIPGNIKDFAKTARAIKNTLRAAASAKNNSARLVFLSHKPGMLTTSFDGRTFCVCALETLQENSSPVFLDIDADFLIIHSILESGRTQKIGARSKWIAPASLARALSSKIAAPAVITIAYSTNGGWTPMRFRYLADELAHCLAPDYFKKRYRQRNEAAHYFDSFMKTGSRQDYRRAIEGDSGLRGWDNNYGPLYLESGRFSRARKEFQRILKVDAQHAGALWGMGFLEERKKNFKKARRLFERALHSAQKYRVFSPQEKGIFFSLAAVAFRLKNFKLARKMFLACYERDPLDPRPRFFLGCLAVQERLFERAAAYYKEAIQLGFDDEKPILELMKIVKNCKQNGDIIKYIQNKIKVFRRNFLMLKLKSVKKPVRGLLRMAKVLQMLENKLEQLKGLVL